MVFTLSKKAISSGKNWRCMNGLSYESVYYTDGKKQKKNKNFSTGFPDLALFIFQKIPIFPIVKNAQFSLIKMLLNDTQGRKFLRINFPMSKND